jgi:hypothetical protein
MCATRTLGDVPSDKAEHGTRGVWIGFQSRTVTEQNRQMDRAGDGQASRLAGAGEGANRQVPTCQHVIHWVWTVLFRTTQVHCF